MNSDFKTRFKAVVALEALKGSKTTGQLAAECGVDEDHVERWKVDVIAILKAFGASDPRPAERLPRRRKLGTKDRQPGCPLSPVKFGAIMVPKDAHDTRPNQMPDYQMTNIYRNDEIVARRDRIDRPTIHRRLEFN